MPSDAYLGLLILGVLAVFGLAIAYNLSLSPEERQRRMEEFVRGAKRRRTPAFKLWRKPSVRDRLRMDPEDPRAIGKRRSLQKRYRRYQ